MASRLRDRFEQLRAQVRAAFIPYVTAGDPDLETTGAILSALAEGGADVIELGVPYSDPMADGPVIEAAMVRAIARGATFTGVLDVVRRFRAEHDTPLVLFGYLNPMYRYGLERAVADAADAGADGFLVVDMPPEEAPELVRHTSAAGLDFIALFTPTSDDARVARIAEQASGFAYYVSMGGVTGDALTALDIVRERVTQVRAIAGLPVCVGFGIRTPEDAANVAAFADGAIVGTALVQALADAPEGGHAEVARTLARSFRAALEGVAKG